MLAKMRSACRSAGSCNPESRAVKHFALVHYGTAILAVVLVVGLSSLGAVDGANVQAMYAFGDSYDDTGNNPRTYSPQVWHYPYGITYPGYPWGRWSDGRDQADCFAELLGLPSPVPYVLVSNDSSTPHDCGVNFAHGGAAVTFAYGITPLDVQVDQMVALVETGVVIKDHLKKSVTLINIGINDYDFRNTESFQTSATFAVSELNITAAIVVNGIAISIVRLHDLGLRNFVVTNLPPLPCIPNSELEGMYQSCSSNSTLLDETSVHDALLQDRVKVLNRQLPGIRIVIADQTKAFDQLFNHGGYGFVDPLTPCCHGLGTHLYELVCGLNDTAGNPIYTLCQDPSKHVLWDGIHPTQAAWRAILKLFFYVSGYTLEGPMLSTWIDSIGHD